MWLIYQDELDQPATVGEGFEAFCFVVEDDLREAEFFQRVQTTVFDELATHVPEGGDVGVEQESSY